MIRTIRSEWIKLRTVRMNLVLFILGVAFPVIVSVLVSSLVNIDDLKISDVAGELVVEREFQPAILVAEDVDFLVGPAIDDHQLAGAGDFPREADAAGTHHATVDEQRDRVSQFPSPAGEGLNVGPPLVASMLEVIVLQRALACLVADGAIDGVAEEQILLDHGPGFNDFWAIGHEHSAVGSRRLARGDDLGLHRDFAGRRVFLSRLHQAHAAARNDRKPRMPAVPRNVNAGTLGNLNAIQALLVANRDFLAVDDYRGHGGSVKCRV